MALTAIYGEDSPPLRRLEDVSFISGSILVAGDTDRSYEAHSAAFHGRDQVVDQLVAVKEDIEEHLDAPTGPALSTDGMHPWVVDASAGLWADGHRQAAVQAAATAVERRLKLKLGSTSGSVASLAASAFSVKPPDEKGPRLRFPDAGSEPSDDWTSAHEGAGAFGRGCFMRIRNLYTHATGRSEQEDLEALAALSLLARWIADADVVRAKTD